jgi:hypothetical protein
LRRGGEGEWASLVYLVCMVDVRVLVHACRSGLSHSPITHTCLVNALAYTYVFWLYATLPTSQSFPSCQLYSTPSPRV